MTVEVIFSPEATDDLISLYDYLADGAGEARAFAFVDSIRLQCLDLATFPQRGSQWNDLRPGLRTIGFRRRVTIAFHITPTQVVIDRILYAGRNLAELF